MSWSTFGWLAGVCFALGLIAAFDRIGAPHHSVGVVGAALLGFGGAGLGSVIGKAAER